MQGFTQSLRAEFRKLLSTRSTWGLLGFALLLDIFVSFWVTGLKASAGDAASANYLAGNMRDAVSSALALFPALVVAILVTQEYRYSTILYALTSSPSRLRVLLAKIVASSVFMVVTVSYLALMVPFLTALGVHLSSNTLAAQSIPFAHFAWQIPFYAWGWGMLALILGALLRNQVAAIVTLLIGAQLVELLVGHLLQNNAVYLPFASLNQIIGEHNLTVSSYLTAGKAALVFLVYVVVGWIASCVLLLKRDAN